MPPPLPSPLPPSATLLLIVDRSTTKVAVPRLAMPPPRAGGQHELPIPELEATLPAMVVSRMETEAAPWLEIAPPAPARLLAWLSRNLARRILTVAPSQRAIARPHLAWLRSIVTSVSRTVPLAST